MQKQETTIQCNIQGNEVRIRFWTGVFGAISSFIFLILIFFNKNFIYFYGFSISIFISAMGFIQAREKYCVYIGIFDLLKDYKNHKEEIKHIFRSIGISFFISFIISGIVFLLFK